MKMQVLAGAAVLALIATADASAATKNAGAYAAPSQPVAYSKLDSYLKASPSKKAKGDWSLASAAPTGAAANTSATTGMSPTAPASAPDNSAGTDASGAATAPPASQTPPATPPDQMTPSAPATPDSSAAPTGGPA